MPVSSIYHLISRSILLCALLFVFILHPSSAFVLERHILSAASVSAATPTLAGIVTSGEQPIANSLVTLYRSTKDKTTGLVELGKSKTNADGIFTIPYTPPRRRQRRPLSHRRGRQVTLLRSKCRAGARTNPSRHRPRHFARPIRRRHQ